MINMHAPCLLLLVHILFPVSHAYFTCNTTDVSNNPMLALDTYLNSTRNPTSDPDVVTVEVSNDTTIVDPTTGEASNLTSILNSTNEETFNLTSSLHSPIVEIFNHTHDPGPATASESTYPTTSSDLPAVQETGLDSRDGKLNSISSSLIYV